jgi:hypothetical protein
MFVLGKIFALPFEKLKSSKGEDLSKEEEEVSCRHNPFFT